MKMNYTQPEIEVIVLEVEDVMTASGEVTFDIDGILSGNSTSWY